MASVRVFSIYIEAKPAFSASPTVPVVGINVIADCMRIVDADAHSPGITEGVGDKANR